jgi:hypothetical protein
VLWLALVLNGGMFLTELVAGLAAGSAALQADALDFLSDAANYGISLSVIGLALLWRARAALVKGISMGRLGLCVSPSFAVRPNGAVHQWREDPPRKLSVGPGS